MTCGWPFAAKDILTEAEALWYEGMQEIVMKFANLPGSVAE
jgi:hypothetical protein